MNYKAIESYIEDYKSSFEKRSNDEIYKWKAVKCFQDNWNINAVDFAKMFRNSTNQTVNLLASRNYYPLSMMDSYINAAPNDIKILFENLFDENISLIQRIEGFTTSINNLHNKLYTKEDKKKSQQDHRAIMVYLNLMYPNIYFLYQFRLYENINQKLEFDNEVKRGSINNILFYTEICKDLRIELIKDDDLLHMHHKRLGDDCCLTDDYHLLTQDFVYYVATVSKKHFEKNKYLINANCDFIESSNYVNEKDSIKLKGYKIDYEKQNKINSKLGSLGEDYVMKYEKAKLIGLDKNKLADKVERKSIIEGDGLGFDILSFDENGKEIFIEVKATKGSKDNPFYITNSELLFSQLNKDRFYLYRLYNYDEENNLFEIEKIKGDLTHLCDQPISFKIHLKNRDE